MFNDIIKDVKLLLNKYIYGNITDLLPKMYSFTRVNRCFTRFMKKVNMYLDNKQIDVFFMEQG